MLSIIPQIVKCKVSKTNKKIKVVILLDKITEHDIISVEKSKEV